MAKILGYINLYDSPELGGLTKHRTPASTSFLGRFALIDFALSNFANANVNDLNILVKNNYRSVAKHCGSLRTWISNPKIGRFNFLINERGIADKDYNSDLNAIRENDWVLYESSADYIVIQPAHIITRIDINNLVKFHRKSGADITMAYTTIDNGDVSFLTSTVLDIKDGLVLSSVQNDGSKKKVDVSLRTYVFSRSVFETILKHKDYRNALSLRMLLTKVVNDKSAVVKAYKYDGYARCFDSLEHFVEYSFELLNPEVADKLFTSEQRVFTLSKNTPPTSYGETADVKNSFIANGAHINGKVEGSIISRYVTVEEGATIKNSIILTRTVVKKGSVVENAVVDKYSFISSEIKGTKEEPLYLKQGSKKWK